MANSLKYHKCDSCAKSFRKNYELERHLHTVHDGYKAHKCEYCDKSFSHTNSLKILIKIIHHGQRDNKCSKSFITTKQLKNHTNKIHGKTSKC